MVRFICYTNNERKIYMNKRKKYLVLDVETANGLTDPLVYDFGYQVVDKYGEVYEKGSFLIRNIIADEKELMKTAYYADKLPQYREEYKRGKHKLVTFYRLRMIINDVIERYDINDVGAYNARFDYRALHTTQRFLTSSKYRWFFRRRVTWFCIWKMAKSTICKQKTYEKFCREHGFISKNGQLKTSAEIVYRYMVWDPIYQEEHTGLEDVKIETEIMALAFRQKKKMDYHAFE